MSKETLGEKMFIVGKALEASRSGEYITDDVLKMSLEVMNALMNFGIGFKSPLISSFIGPKEQELRSMYRARFEREPPTY